MPKFKKKSKTSQEIPTSALPDIIFMLLFFFMVSTVIKDTSIKVEQHTPKATQLRKLEKKSLVSYLYVGKPLRPEMFGSEPKIQANDVFITTDDVTRWVQEEKAKLSEAEQDQLTVSMKVDIEAKMGLISDIQQELRMANARKLMYAAVGKSKEDK